jgi:quinol monooxygenase YgiN
MEPANPAGRRDAMSASRRTVLTRAMEVGVAAGLAGLSSASAQAPPPDAPRSPVGASSDQAAEGAEALARYGAADQVVMIAELEVKPGALNAFLEYTSANLHLSRSYAGNIAFEIFINEADPHRITFYEVWTSPEAQKAYMACRIQAGDLTKLMSYLAAQPRFTAFRRVAR